MGYRSFLLDVEDGQIGVGLHVAEILGDDVDHFVGIEITREADGHVVGHIPLFVVVLDVGDGGILEVLLCAEHGLCSVGVVGEECREHGLGHLAVVLGEAHVFLLVDGFELGVESAQHGVLEAVGLDACPVFDLVGGYVLDVAGLVVGGVGIRTVGADGGHEFVVLVGNGYERCFIAYGVNLTVDVAAFHRVGGVAVDLKEVFDFVEQGLFGRVILGAESFCTLEHEMLEIVGEAGGFGRVILAADADCDVGLDAGFVLVDAHVNLEAVGQGVDFCAQWIALDGAVVILRRPCPVASMAASTSRGREKRLIIVNDWD